MKNLLLLFLAFLWLNFAFGQNPVSLDEVSRNEIKLKVQINLGQYGNVLNQLISPQMGDLGSKYIIQNSFSSTSNNQIFYEDARIEDNRSTAKPYDATVEEYLKDFWLLERNKVSQVLISEIQIGDIHATDKEHNYTITANFKIDLLKGATVLITNTRKATFIATYAGQWEVLIKSIVHEDKITDPPPVVRQPPLIVSSVYIDSLNINEFFTVPPVNLAVRPVNFSKPATFKPLPENMKWKKTYPIVWENATRPQTLWLYRGETLQQTLAQSTTGNSFKWTVPQKLNGQKLQPGQGYNFRLYNPNTKLTAKSGNFSIRRKLPLGVQIPIYIGIVGGITALIIHLSDGPEECTDCLPTLPTPNELNPYDN